MIFAALIVGTLVVLMPARDHLGTASLLGRRADRVGDLQTAEGLRITALVEAERWLQANLQPSDSVLTSMPRHLAWYARTGVDGYLNTVTTGELAREWPERWGKILQLLAQPSAIDYVIDFNLDWTRPQSSEARAWYALYRWLRTRPYLEEVYNRPDPNGRVVLYAFRNHRWALSPSYEDREEARAAQLAAGRES
ncbi:MAG: hypothetical protein HY690_02610 [Chloroflexi bacterium]|nr:hypothetical protein [Chloroflexota bacterium]